MIQEIIPKAAIHERVSGPRIIDLSGVVATPDERGNAGNPSDEERGG